MNLQHKFISVLLNILRCFCAISPLVKALIAAYIYTKQKLTDCTWSSRNESRFNKIVFGTAPRDSIEKEL